MICTMACIARDFKGNRIQVNAGDIVINYTQKKNAVNITLMIGKVTVSKETFQKNFGNPKRVIHRAIKKVPVFYG